jgi:hypothetical protein
MVRAQTLASLVALSASLAVLSLPAAAAAQCCGGGRGSSTGMGPGPGGLLTQMQQQMMQMQVMQMQMQMMQAQSQQMQMQQLVNSKLVDLMQQMSNKDSGELKIALEDSQAETRWAAARTIGLKRLPLQDALIEHITDPSGEVRQAARGALIQLSSPPASGTAKSAKSKSVDFGPSPSASRSAQATAARKWSDWWAKQAPSQDSSTDRSSARASR